MAGLHLATCNFEFLIGQEAQGQRGDGFELLARHKGRDVAGIGEFEVAGRENTKAAGGGESELPMHGKSIVEMEENGRGIVRTLAAQYAEDQGDAHSRG